MLNDSLSNNATETNSIDEVNMPAADGNLDELAIAKKQAAEYLAGWQRAKADYANLKREQEAKYLDLIKYANEELLKELLPLVDYFKHALKAVPETERGAAWVEGIRHIQSKLEQILAYYGVKEMEVIGEKFDPRLHEAVGEVQNSEYSVGVIVEEVRTGFTYHDKVLQAARVKVAK
ncbi:MAG: nucleotide exchange factor GrpE [Patescibacteria group bacterium]